MSMKELVKQHLGAVIFGAMFLFFIQQIVVSYQLQIMLGQYSVGSTNLVTLINSQNEVIHSLQAKIDLKADKPTDVKK